MKAFTDIEQSKKLAEILPLDSADMWWNIELNDDNEFDGYDDVPYYYQITNDDIPCWSLVALLDVLPKNLNIGRPSLESNYKGCYWIQYYDEFMKPNDYKTECFNNPIDACVAMIDKLHELKML